MTDFSFEVQPDELGAASSSVQGAASALSGLKLTAPDTSMYGAQVGAAADDVEPATTDDINDLLQALSQVAEAISLRLTHTRTGYIELEQHNGVAISNLERFRVGS